ncbi:DEAD/DEAH box helicase [Halobaculum marinum]|uniref:DEAD/DEAH box helicase n=1 Tax=Halobaculum marinum TaxID=3031996 RepID=A0ABD5WSK6_9EURY|nr:DEAD/DEAH box helicase [Halobaculum sp. DT55]
MSNRGASQTVDRAAIEQIWSEFTESTEVYRDVRDDIVRIVTEMCRRQINAGTYDSAASLSEVFGEFKGEHLATDAAFRQEVLESGETQMITLELGSAGEENLAHVVFDRLVEELVEDRELLYVHNRQQVRSHVAEMARYFALIRQRINVDTDYSFTPNLVKMVKLASAPREQPIMGKDEPEAMRFQAPLREISERIDAEGFTPAWELRALGTGDWRRHVTDTVETLSEFFTDRLPEDFDSLAAFQGRALRDIYLDAISDSGSDPEQAHVVTASTGGGKTEAFLFPTLAYALTANRAGLEGNKGVLTYPRRDLCDNQFERAFDYITELNRLGSGIDGPFESSDLTIGIQHGGRDDVTLPCPYCDGELAVPEGYENTHFVCQQSDRHEIRYATVDRSEPADIIVTTQSSLHRRLMDHYGDDAFWSAQSPPKFLVLDEVHIYTDQAGMNVANVVRRFKQALRHRGRNQSPTLVASSATIENAESFTSGIFDVESEAVNRVKPRKDEKTTLGREHFVFVKATDPRDVQIPIGDSVFKPREEWTEMTTSTATNLSCMIQIAFAFHHTMRKERAGSREGLDNDKDRILGFVDSIDSVSRLGGYVQDAEEKGLFKYRIPDALLNTRGNNPDCPSDRFQQGTDDEYEETAVCESVVPDPNVNPCPVYEDGECWWTMRDERLDLQSMTVGIHKSGRTQHAGEDRPLGDEWDQLISTSALEVGFDHPSIIGTFQYRAPRNVPGFLQRKGRGGRDAEDEPVTVVVLGSTPTDSYYFHHSNYLSDPRDEHLEIPLDEENRFVRAEHMTAAVIDYFNVTDGTNARKLFSGFSTSQYGPGPDVDYLRDQFERHRQPIRQWLNRAFDADSKEVQQVLDEFDRYSELLDAPVGESEDPYWKFFRRAIKQKQNGTTPELESLLQRLQEER